MVCSKKRGWSWLTDDASVRQDSLRDRLSPPGGVEHETFEILLNCFVHCLFNSFEFKFKFKILKFQNFKFEFKILNFRIWKFVNLNFHQCAPLTKFPTCFPYLFQPVQRIAGIFPLPRFHIPPTGSPRSSRPVPAHRHPDTDSTTDTSPSLCPSLLPRSTRFPDFLVNKRIKCWAVFCRTTKPPSSDLLQVIYPVLPVNRVFPRPPVTWSPNVVRVESGLFRRIPTTFHRRSPARCTDDRSSILHTAPTSKPRRRLPCRRDSTELRTSTPPQDPAPPRLHITAQASWKILSSRRSQKTQFQVRNTVKYLQEIWKHRLNIDSTSLISCVTVCHHLSSPVRSYEHRRYYIHGVHITELVS